MTGPISPELSHQYWVQEKESLPQYWQHFAWRLLSFATKACFGCRFNSPPGLPDHFHKAVFQVADPSPAPPEAGVSTCTCRVLEKIQLISFSPFLGLCRVLILFQPHHVIAQTLQQPVGKVPVPPRHPKHEGISPRSLVRREVSDVLGIIPPGRSRDCSLLCVSAMGEPPGKFLVSLWAPIAVFCLLLLCACGAHQHTHGSHLNQLHGCWQVFSTSYCAVFFLGPNVLLNP